MQYHQVSPACTWSLCCSSHTTAALCPLTDISPALQSPSLPPLATIPLLSASVCVMFMTARIQEQSKGLLTDEWIKKLWSVHVYTHSGVLFSLKKQGDPLNWHFSKADIQMAKKAHGMMSGIPNYQRNTNWNYSEESLHTGQNGHHQKSANNKCGRGCGKKGTLLLVGM